VQKAHLLASILALPMGASLFHEKAMPSSHKTNERQGSESSALIEESEASDSSRISANSPEAFKKNQRYPSACQPAMSKFGSF